MSSADPNALLKLARRDLQEGEHGAAQEKCLRVLTVHEHHPGALELLGEVLAGQGETEAAVRVFNALTLMQPTVAGHWQNLGTALGPTRRFAQALAAFERALHLGPPSADLLYNLGALQMSRYDFAAAYLALRDAVALAPNDARVRWAFAQCCYDLARLEECANALNGWQTFHGLTDEITVLIALLLVTTGVMHEAQEAAERLLANPPLRGRPALAFATILERLHRVDQARVVMERVKSNHTLDDDPEMLLLSAALEGRAGHHDKSYQQLRSALQSQNDFMHRHHILFPLARAADASGHFEEAYAAAGEAHRSQLAFLEATVGPTSVENSQLFALTAHGCDAGDVARWGESGPPMEESPIFIVGFPRSGTTLLEQALDAHPQLQSMDEQPFLLRAVTQVTNSGGRYPAELGSLETPTVDRIRTEYWNNVRTRGHVLAGRRLVDKNPLNLVLLPLIRRLFPHAHIVVAVRHPCDTLISCFMQHFRAPGLAVVCRDLPTLARAYSRAFGFWYSQWPLLRPNSYELRYEQLATDFPVQVRKLSEFLQLPWHNAMLEPGAHALAKGFINTPSYAQVTLPVTNRYVGRWRPYRQHFAPLTSVLAPWLEKWGYPPA